jgi:hypothetical protein
MIGGIKVVNIDLSNGKILTTQDEMVARYAWYKDIIFYLKSGKVLVDMTTKKYH